MADTSVRVLAAETQIRYLAPHKPLRNTPVNAQAERRGDKSKRILK
jgi:hypothetical protein